MATGSKYGLEIYSEGLYSEVSTTPVPFEGIISVIFATAAKATRSKNYLGSFPVNIAFPLSRLSYSASFDPSHMAVVFGTSARLTESEPLRGAFNVELNIPNAPFNRTSTLRASFTVDTYYPMARFVMTRGYIAETTVDFNIAGMFTRSGNREYAGVINVIFDIAVGPLYADVPLSAYTEIKFTINGDDWYGDVAWPPVEIPEVPWTPEAPATGPWTPLISAGGPWIPIGANARNWTPIEDTEKFDA